MQKRFIKIQLIPPSVYVISNSIPKQGSYIILAVPNKSLQTHNLCFCWIIKHLYNPVHTFLYKNQTNWTLGLLFLKYSWNCPYKKGVYFTWNSLCCLKETSLQKCTVMEIYCQENIVHVYFSFNWFFLLSILFWVTLWWCLPPKERGSVFLKNAFHGGKNFVRKICRGIATWGD